MKLSIAMIVKNEEKNIERTLIPLKKLNNYIDTEIIIVDTGSTDETIDIARKYTDKIYLHKWNNNFAYMRNISIKYCTGDWILIVDADEVLYDIEELAMLIKNKALSKYNGAFIKIVNFIKNKECAINYGAVMPLLRLFRKDTVKYTGIIHEQPEFENPLISTNIRFIHYGYDNRDSKLMEYKFERNLKLLLNELKGNPKDIYTNFQIATSYSMHGDIKQSIKYIEIAYKEAKPNFDKYIYVIDKYCFILYKKEDYELLIEKVREGLDYYNYYIDFYFYLGISCYNLNRYEETIEAYNNYLKYYKEENLHFSSTLCATTKQYKDNVLCNLALCYYKLKFYEKGLDTLLKINDKDMIKENALLLLKNIIEGKIYNKINIINEFLDKYNYETILLYMHKEALLDDLQNLNKVILEGQIQEIIDIVKYVKENKIINEHYNKKIKNTIDENNILYTIYVYYLLKYDVKELNYLISYGKDKMEQILFKLCNTYYEVNEFILEGLEKVKDNTLQDVIMRTIMQRAVLLGGNLSEDKKKKLFLNYIAEKYYCICKIYNYELIKKNIWILPSEERFIVELKNTLSYKYEDTLMYIKRMKSALNLEKAYSEYIKILIEEDEINKNIISNEVKAFIPELVKNIKELINNGKYEDAYNTVGQGLGLVQFDVELMVLKYNLLLYFNYKKEAKECLRDIILYEKGDKVAKLIQSSMKEITTF